MIIIICNIIIALVGLAITPCMVNMIDAFSNEEQITLKRIMKKGSFNSKVALITPLVLIALFFKFGMSFQFLEFAFLSIILIMDAFVDLKAQIIPNGLNFTGFIVGIVLTYINLVISPETGLDMILGMLTGGGIFLLIALFAYAAYKKEGMGLGDVKLMGMLGLFFGVYNTLQIFIISFVIGAIASLILLIARIKKTSDYIAFGPFIVISAIITMFWGYAQVFPCYLSFMASICNLG